MGLQLALHQLNQKRLIFIEAVTGEVFFNAHEAELNTYADIKRRPIATGEPWETRLLTEEMGHLFDFPLFNFSDYHFNWE